MSGCRRALRPLWWREMGGGSRRAPPAALAAPRRRVESCKEKQAGHPPSTRDKESLMGLFDFVKDAGKKLFGDDEEKAVAANRDQVANMEAAKRQAVQRKFQNELTTHGLAVENL
jgi:hypothetical protein